MLPKLLWVGALRVIAKALQMEREAARVSSKTRAVGKPTELVLAGSNPLYGALPWEAPSNTSTALYPSKLLSFTPLHIVSNVSNCEGLTSVVDKDRLYESLYLPRQ